MHKFLSNVPSKLKPQINRWHPFVLSLLDSDILTSRKIIDAETVEEGIEELKKISAKEYFKALKKNHTENHLKGKNSSNSTLARYLEEPQELKNFFIDFLNKFYKEYFFEQADRYSLLILRKIREWANLLHHQTLPEFIKNQGGGKLIDYDPRDDILLLKLWLNLETDVEKNNKIVLMPTIFPYFIFSTDEDSGTLYFSLPIFSEKTKDNNVIKQETKILPCINFFASLSDETRMRIFLLLNNQPMCNTDLAKHLGLSSATISQHLGILKDVNLVTGTREKPNKIYYSPNIEQLEKYIQNYRELIKKQKTE